MRIEKLGSGRAGRTVHSRSLKVDSKTALVCDSFVGNQQHTPRFDRHQSERKSGNTVESWQRNAVSLHSQEIKRGLTRISSPRRTRRRYEHFRSARELPLRRTSLPIFSEWLFVLGRLQAFVDDDALRRRKAQAEARAAFRFLRNAQMLFLWL